MDDNEVQDVMQEGGQRSILNIPQIQSLHLDNDIQDQKSVPGELQHIWHSVMTDCLIISRSQASGSSLYGDYKDQVADLWEGFCLARRQNNLRSTGVASPTVDTSAPTESRYDPSTLENISGFIEELALITSVGKENARVSVPILILTSVLSDTFCTNWYDSR